MVDFPLLSFDIQNFINTHLSEDTAALALKKSPFPEVSMRELITQIAGKRKAKEKLQTFFETKNILYPPTVSMEQCSSEETAKYKAVLFPFRRMIDLTGGFGVDSWAFSQKGETVFYCEQNETLAAVVRHNFSALQANNIIVIVGDSIAFLQNQQQHAFDGIYLDPSRRDKQNRKMHAFSDCNPDVSALFPSLFSYAPKILIKASPMFDINRALTELKHVSEVHVVAVKNEVREVLYLIDKQWNDPLNMKAVNIENGKIDVFSFSKQDSDAAKSQFSLPKQYLYEPNAALMKIGSFNLISTRYNLFALHKNTHLYTSDQLLDAFPGRIFRIKAVVPYKKNVYLEQANISVRNFPDSVEIVRKKLKIKEGGQRYLFCTTLMDEKPSLLLCEKI